MMKIGQIETSGEPGRRDAFHVPAVLVMAEEGMSGGMQVRFRDSSFTSAVVVGLIEPKPAHAIADPFVPFIPKGSLFWALLMPGMISDKLTHHFDLNITDVLEKEPEQGPDEDDSCRGCW